MSRTNRILDNALDAVGNTPLIRLDKIARQEGLKCNLREQKHQVRYATAIWCLYFHLSAVGKVEFMSVGGSVKDRIAKKMIEAAEKDGRLIPGKSVVIEPTSGNTGKFTSFIDF